MALKLFVVHSQNDFFKPGTFLVKDEFGYQRCTAVRTSNGWKLQERVSDVVIPSKPEIDKCVYEISQHGELDPKLADLLRATAYKS